MMLMCFLTDMTSGSLFVNDSTFADYFSSFSLGASSFNLLSLFQSCWQLSSTFLFQDENLNDCSRCMVVYEVFCFMEIIVC